MWRSAVEAFVSRRGDAMERNSTWSKLLPAVSLVLGVELLPGPLLADQPEASPALVTDRGGAGDRTRPSGDEPLGRQVAEALVRLDRRLALGTRPYGSPTWIPRIVAALERRVREADETGGASGRDILRRLAIELRPLAPDEELVISDTVRSGVPGEEREARLHRVLAAIRRVHEKLDATAARDARSGRPSPRAAPANDDCQATGFLGAAPSTVAGSSAGATGDGASSCGGSADVWYFFEAASAGTYTFDTFGSSFDTVLSLHDDCPRADGRDVELACSDDAGGALASEITLSLMAGASLWLRVSGAGGASGPYKLNVARPPAIAGAVTRADTGAPIPGAGIELYDHRGFFLKETTTRSDGSWVAGALAAGSHRARTRTDSAVDELYDDIACPSYVHCWPPEGTPITVTSTVVRGVDFALEPGGSIAGTVTDAATGDPLEGFVYLYDDAGQWLDSYATGADGTYEFSGIPAATYYTQASAVDHAAEVYEETPCGHTCDPLTGTPVPVAADAAVSGIDFTLEPLARIEGTITEQTTGSPIEGAFVTVYDEAGEWAFFFDVTEADGRYEIALLPLGTYYLTASEEDFQGEVHDDVPCIGCDVPCIGCDFTGSAPITMTGLAPTIEIDFALERLGAIEGIVTHAVDGSPADLVVVRAHDATGSEVGWGFADWDGSYRIARLYPGSYYVKTDDPSYWDEVYDGVSCEPCNVTSGTPVPVAIDSTTAGIDFALDRLGSVSGSVRSAASGNLLASWVLLFDGAGQNLAQYHALYGTYTFPDVSPGVYYVMAFDLFDSYQDELFDDVPCEPCDLSSGTPLAVGLNTDLTGIDFSLAACPHETFRFFGNFYVDWTDVVEACDVVRSADAILLPGADVTLRSGRLIVLGDGFRVEEGASFRAVIEPSWAGD